MPEGFLPPVVATLRADISDFKGKMGEARAETLSMASQGGANMDKFAAVGKTALLGLGVAAVAVGVIGVKAAMEQEQAHARLVTALNNSGVGYHNNAEQVEHLDASGRHLGFTNLDIENSLTRLVPVTHDMHKATTDLALAEDIARGRHISLQEATDGLSKIELGRTRGLVTLGVNMKDATGATLSQHDAIDKLTRMYGGQASAYTDTLAGKFAVLSAEGENLAETVGAVLIPVITELGGDLADGIGWLTQHKEAAAVLAVVIGGPLVFAMAAYVREQALAGAGWLIAQWSAMASIAGEAASGVMVLTGALDAAEVGAIGAGVAIALPVAAALALGYGIHTLVGGFDDVYDAFHRGQDEGRSLADAWVAAAKKTDDPVKSLREDLSALNVSHAQHLAALRADGKGFDDAAQEALRYHTATQALRKGIHDLEVEHQAAVATTHQLAHSYGVELPPTAGMSTEAVKQMQAAFKDGTAVFDANSAATLLCGDNTGAALQAAAKDAQQFATSMHDSISKATDPFAKFGTATDVSESDMEQFFVGSNANAQAWSSEMGGVINRIKTELPAGAQEGVLGLVQEMAKAGPDSKPALDAFLGMVDQHNLQWVADQVKATSDVEAITTAGYNALAVTAAIKGAEITAINRATYQDVEENGTRHLEALLHNSDKNLGEMAYGAILKLGEIRGGVESIPTSWFTTFGADASAVWAAVQSAKAALAQLPTGLNGGVNILQWTLDHPGQALPGAHGLVGLARGGSAGMIVGPNQPVLIGEGLSREAVVPFDNFGDMVNTIKNTGRSGDFMRASIRAGGVPSFTSSGSSPGGAGGVAVGGGVTNIIHVHGSVVTERELVDLMQEGLLRNSRQGRG